MISTRCRKSLLESFIPAIMLPSASCLSRFTPTLLPTYLGMLYTYKGMLIALAIFLNAFLSLHRYDDSSMEVQKLHRPPQSFQNALQVLQKYLYQAPQPELLQTSFCSHT